MLPRILQILKIIYVLLQIIIHYYDTRRTEPQSAEHQAE